MSDFVLDTRVLDELIKECPELVDKAIRETAFQVQGISQGLVAVDTGATRNSAFTETSKGSTFDEAASKASGLRPGAEIVNATPGKPPLMTAYVSYGTNYAIWIEIGTKRMAARPFLSPATDKADDLFEKNIKKELDK